jgi:hypothetical protein
MKYVSRLYTAGFVIGLIAVVTLTLVGYGSSYCPQVGEVKFGFVVQMHPIPLRCNANHRWVI